MQAKGFTLIELLTVITIISLLAAILLPALKGARERGRMIACLNNMKQMCLGFEMYINDFDGLYPLCGWYFDEGMTVSYGVGQPWLDAIAPYLSWKAEIFVCLSDPDPDNFEWYCWEGESAFSRCSYSANEDILGIDNYGNYDEEHDSGAEGRVGGDGRKVKNPSKCALIVDGDYMWVNSQSTYFEDRVLYHHIDGFNAVFCDSHASWIPRSKIDEITLDPGCLY